MHAVDDAAVYCTCMEKVRERINVVQTIAARKITTTYDVLDIELCFVQFRKALELIAFASLAANREKYAEAHANFGVHCRAKDMLKVLDKINPDFYPVPLGEPRAEGSGLWHFPPPQPGWLTRDQFAALYDLASDVLHMRNPFSPRDPGVNMIHPMHEWVRQVQRLISVHMLHLVDGGKWVVKIPREGPIQLFPAAMVTTDV
jgi:hypothetical protein